MFRCTVVALLTLPAQSLGQIVSYELASLLPDEFGFVRGDRVYPLER